MRDPQARVCELEHTAVAGPVPLRTLDRDARPFPPAGAPPRQPLDDRWHDVVATLDIAFQPIVNIHTGACYGVEALLRNTAEAGFASIQDFFDSCAALDVLADIEMILRERAVAKFATLAHHHQIRLFINLDNRSLEPHGALPSRTRAMLARHGVAESSVVFEVSERQPLGKPAELTAMLHQYRRHNFRLAVDDFGTGFSGLQLLYFVEPDVLKIDRFFVADIASDSKKRLFLSQIVHIAHLLGVVVLAEGVETEREYYVCRDIGCELIQGYLVQHPTCDAGALKAHYDEVEGIARRERRVAVSDQKLIGDQVCYIAPIPLASGMEEVFQRFRLDKTSTFFPVTDVSGEPVGIVREKDLKAYAYSPFGKELMRNKALGRSLKDFVTRCPTADINSRAENILQAYSAVESTEGIVIVDDMKYVGFLSAHSLLRVINEKNLATARDQNPLTKLPGNSLIHEYVSEALADAEAEVVLAYFDFDNFKPFNDTYGFRLGDRAILLFAELCRKAAQSQNWFIGHIGGDDFFVGIKDTPVEAAAAAISTLITRFAQDAESFYDARARERGSIVAQDREGNVKSFPLLSASAVLVVVPADSHGTSIDDVSAAIATRKKESKASPAKMVIETLVRA